MCVICLRAKVAGETEIITIILLCNCSSAVEFIGKWNIGKNFRIGMSCTLLSSTSEAFHVVCLIFIKNIQTIEIYSPNPFSLDPFSPREGIKNAPFEPTWAELHHIKAADCSFNPDYPALLTPTKANVNAVYPSICMTIASLWSQFICGRN